MSQTCRLIQDLHSRLSKRSGERETEEVGGRKESMFGAKRATKAERGPKPFKSQPQARIHRYLTPAHLFLQVSYVVHAAKSQGWVPYEGGTKL